jgi:leucyl-tRNA synthetase
MAPMMPHLGEELWHALGHETLLVDEPWPEADSALLIEDTVKIAVQVQGKLRGTIEMPRDADQSACTSSALATATVTNAIDGRPIKKTVFVPNRIINFLV